MLRLVGLTQNSKSHESLTGSSTEQFNDLLRIHAFQQQSPRMKRLDSQSTIMEHAEEKPNSTHSPDSGEIQEALKKFKIYN